jgi:hypothetical protein
MSVAAIGYFSLTFWRPQVLIRRSSDSKSKGILTAVRFFHCLPVGKPADCNGFNVENRSEAAVISNGDLFYNAAIRFEGGGDPSTRGIGGWGLASAQST